MWRDKKWRECLLSATFLAFMNSGILSLHSSANQHYYRHICLFWLQFFSLFHFPASQSTNHPTDHVTLLPMKCYSSDRSQQRWRRSDDIKYLIGCIKSVISIDFLWIVGDVCCDLASHVRLAVNRWPTVPIQQSTRANIQCNSSISISSSIMNKGSK